MATLAVMENPSVRRWLGGVDPVWSMLDQASARALERAPSPKGPIRLAADLSRAEIGQSAVARGALVLLHAAATGSGLKLTAAGNLTRAVVDQMGDLFEWPDFDRATAAEADKVINEADFLPLYFVRNIASAAELLRKYKGRLKTTPAGHRLLDEDQQGPLQAILFHIAFWYFNLAYFDRGPHDGWPQTDAGVVLWCLSIAAKEWQHSDRLTRLCAIPIDSVVDAQYDMGPYAMEARILRPLQWFGLLELRREDIPGERFGERRFYRKSPLFDRFLSFDVHLERADGERH